METHLNLPRRDLLIEHVLFSLNVYWSENSEKLHSLPIYNNESNIKISIPLQLEGINLPSWAYDLGIDDLASADDGQIEFIECDSPGSNYRGVEADMMGLSLLQDKLNQLDTAIEIFMFRCSKS